MTDQITEPEFLLEIERFKWYSRAFLQPLSIDIIEDFIGNSLNINEITKKYHCSHEMVCRILKQYSQGVDRPLTLISRI